MAFKRNIRRERLKYTALVGTIIVVAVVSLRAALIWAFRESPSPVAADALLGAITGWYIRGEWENSIWRR